MAIRGYGPDGLVGRLSRVQPASRSHRAPMNTYSRYARPLALAVVAGLLLGVACGPEPEPEPVQLPPQPRLTAGTDAQINMFGELPGLAATPYRTRMGMSLRRHTFAEEGADCDPDIAPASQRLVFASTRHSPKPDLYLKSVDGLAVTQLTADPAADVQPALAPDGRQVAFASDRAGNWDIWIIDTDGHHPVQVTSGSANDLSPSWSPDGRSLVFSSRPSGGGQWELWIVDAAAGGAKKFIGYGLFPEWSPVGDTILYQRARQRGSRWFSIWTLELVDGEPRYPTEIASSADQALILPTWSTDGLQVAYCAVTSAPGGSDEGLGPAETADIWVVGVDGSGRMRLTDGHSANFAPVWAGDGRLYFTSTRDGFENVWSLAPSDWTPGAVDQRTVLTQGRPFGPGREATGGRPAP